MILKANELIETLTSSNQIKMQADFKSSKAAEKRSN